MEATTAITTLPQEGNKRKKKKIILITLGTLGVGTLAFFGWQYLKGRKAKKQQNEDSQDSVMLEPPKANTFQQAASTPAKPQRNDDFPLKLKSYGPKVKALQEALMAAPYNQKIKADSDFGSKTVAALKSAGFSDSIDETTYNVIVYGGGLDADDMATKLYNAAKSKNLADALKYLKQLKNKDDYKAVSEIFKQKPSLTKFDNNSLVNGMLYSFDNESQKKDIRLAFTNMGLKYDGKKWSLDGIEGMNIITTSAAVVWKNPNLAIKVPANMVLGTEITRRNQYTLFENNGHKFLVETNSIKYL